MAKVDSILRTLRFGTEIETVGIGREAAALAVASALPGSTVRYAGGGYDKWEVVTADGRRWTVMRDRSLVAGGAEVVTPILTLVDMPALQAVVRALRAAGATVNEGCGQHVHVDGAAFIAAPKKLKTLVLNFYRMQDLFFASNRSYSDRLRFCRRVDGALVSRFTALSSNRMSDYGAAWYGDERAAAYARHEHYHRSRYAALNLHSLFYRGTVEFRHFNGTLHAGEVRANVMLALGVVANALASALPSVRSASNPWTYTRSKCWMTRLCVKKFGLVGDEFAAVRAHLTKRLPGRDASDEAFEDRAA